MLQPMSRVHGGSENDMLIVQTNLAITYEALGRDEEALEMKRDVYFGFVKLLGMQDDCTLKAANNYAISLINLQRFEEAKALFLKVLPVARRVLGNSNDTMLRMRSLYAQSLYRDHAATLDDLRKAVETIEETKRTARRVLGGSHPLISAIDGDLQDARDALRVRETSV